MNVSVNIEAVRQAMAIIDESRTKLAANHNSFTTLSNNALSQWQDVHVEKFVKLYGGMTEDLRQIMQKMAMINDFCREVYNWICSYSDM